LRLVHGEAPVAKPMTVAELERISKMPQQDDCAGEVEKSEVVRGLALVAGVDTPESLQPGE
jgi:hypothetical protein